MSSSTLRTDGHQTGGMRDRHATAKSDFDVLASLRTWFATDFHLVDGGTGDVLRTAANQRSFELSELGPLCRVVAERGRAELLNDDESLIVLAIPFPGPQQPCRVAVGVFVSAMGMTKDGLAQAARRFGGSLEQTVEWISKQPRWTPFAVLAMGQLAVERLAADGRAESLEEEVHDVSLQLSVTYEEISLLHRLTQNLKLTSDGQELAQRSLEWLTDVVPAESLAIQWNPTDRGEGVGTNAQDVPELLTHGPCPVDAQGLREIVERFELQPGRKPLILNPPATNADDWKWPDVSELVIVPLSEGDNCFGWLAAFNHVDRGQFGSVEASLLGSIGVILGIHRGNAELYEQQREFFASTVRALSSAIDAKDPYTCGHSDRVARVAVRLAEELECSREQIETVYLSGLLHDVGKIGIDDGVLRKPGKLTNAEYEHIKTHTEIGYKILVGIKQLDEVLPVVLHHHEQWNGHGYPSGLKADKIPLLARIVAVADSFDAMSSDRPYRSGMPDEKLDAIIRDGAGSQWDAKVVEAFFRAREDIRRIAAEPVNRVTLQLDK